MNITRAIGTIGGLTMVSRVLGFARDVLMSSILGATAVADAFLIAFRLPNTFRRFFGEGAFSAGFVPLFSQRFHGEGGLEEAKKFSEEVLAIFLPALILFTAFAQLIMPALVWLIASGYVGDAQKFAMAVDLNRITFFYLLFISLVSLFSGILNSMNRFVAAAFAPALLNLCMMLALVLVPQGGYASAQALAIAVVVGGVAQLALLLWTCRRTGITLKLRKPKMTPGVRQFFKVVIPATFAAGVYQVAILIDTSFVSYLKDGSQLYLNNADRLNQLPLGIIGTALGTAILPSISKFINQNKPEVANRIQNQAMDLAMLLSLPAAIGLAAAAVPVCIALFARGKFTVEDAQVTGQLLAIMAAGLPAYVLVKVLTPGFFAREDTKTPLRIALWVLGANVALNFALIPFFGILGLGVALALTAWINCAMLYITLRRRGHFTILPSVGKRLIRQIIAGAAMGVVILFAVHFLDGAYGGSTMERVFALAALVGPAMIVYFGLGWMIGAVDKDDIMTLFRKKKAASIEDAA
jgi:putative peptidoglycan lipid II flippase